MTTCQGFRSQSKDVWPLQMSGGGGKNNSAKSWRQQQKSLNTQTKLATAAFPKVFMMSWKTGGASSGCIERLCQQVKARFPQGQWWGWRPRCPASPQSAACRPAWWRHSHHWPRWLARHWCWWWHHSPAGRRCCNRNHRKNKQTLQMLQYLSCTNKGWELKQCDLMATKNCFTINYTRKSTQKVTRAIWLLAGLSKEFQTDLDKYF